MSFYVTLVSTASSKEIPSNTQSQFTTLLNPPIELVGQYEVALVEIAYSNRIKVDLGSIIFPNPFFGNETDIGRVETIEVPLECYNGERADVACIRFNNEINRAICIAEYSYLRRLANFSPDSFLEASANMKHKKGITGKELSLVMMVGSQFETFDQFDAPSLQKYGHLITHDVERKRYTWTDPNIINIMQEMYDVHIIIVPDRKDTYSIQAFYAQGDQTVVNPIHSNILSKIARQASDIPLFKYMNNFIDITSTKSLHLKGLITAPIAPDTYEFVTKGGKVSIESTYQLHYINTAMVLTDIISDVYYGNVKSPVLYTLNLRTSTPNTVLTLQNPHYIPVSKNYIPSINMRILDLSSQPIKFSDIYSFVILKLNFRKNA